eukprot:CAMPEP_0179100504 /NCGR_PEP_ID=MMETSP0796-20121207/46421_1 /TAXON_ID=73915 /ORGANISM="Pyrodinium bahamense, Strain pbaha01" /LENGTH=476 /DNA_ID=CAMNT_0020798331 /DNA_START=26 /DNA_END=1454 /DNA_ORIENTATION=-
MLNACVLMELSTGLECRSSNHVPSTKRALELELIDAEGIDSQSLLAINSTPHKVHLLFTWIQQLIVESNTKQVFGVQAPILSRCFQELGNGMVSYRQAAKIATIPLPFPYVQATEMLLLSHWFLIPFLMCVWVSSPIWTGILTFVQVAFFWSLNSIATELENPFGEDTNDLPAQAMQREFNQELLLLLRPSTAVTAKLSKKAVLTEMQDLKGPSKLARCSTTMTLGKMGVNDVPHHMRRSSLEGNSISLAGLQECITDMQTRDYVSESGCDSDYMVSRRPTKESNLALVVEAQAQSQVRFADPSGGAGSQQSGSTQSSSAEPEEGLLTAKMAAAPKECNPAGDPSTPGSSARTRQLLAELRCLEASYAPEEKSVEPARWRMASDLAWLPELVTVCEEMRDQLRALQPELVPAHLACLPEALHFGAFSAGGGAASEPVVALDPDLQLRRAAAHRAAARPLDGGCVSLRSCVPQESHW